MDFNIQPVLDNRKVILYPLKEKDFEALYTVASDPKIWEQHPNKNRWNEEVFKTFFDGAIESNGAFIIVDKATNVIIGCTRFYDYSKETNSIHIGYTFYAKKYWGTGINVLVKASMFNYIFQYVSKVILHIGADNIRSQVSVGRLGAEKITEQEVTYFGETPKLNFVYEISKEKWQQQNK